MSNVQVKKALCRWCHNRCRVSVYVENGKLKKIEEDSSDPRVKMIYPPTKACLRLNGAKQWFYHPNRLSYPLKRAGIRGEGKWQRVPWDQALDEIASKLDEIRRNYGAEAVATSSGTARTEDVYRSRFFNLFGSPNWVGQGTHCFAPNLVMAAAMFGWPPRYKSAPEKANCLMIFGIDPSKSMWRMWKGVRDAKKRGAPIIVIDPRPTDTTRMADLWLQPRPGTDGALIMAMMHVIVSEELYDKDFVRDWCYGFDKLVERVKEYSPEKVAEITWVSRENIEKAARLYAQNRPACTSDGMGIQHQHSSIQTIHARFALAAITGNIDIEGGQEIPGPNLNFIEGDEVELNSKLPPDQRKKQMGSDRFRLLSLPGYELVQPMAKKTWGKEFGHIIHFFAGHGPDLYRAMITGKPYPIKAMITMSSNPMVTQANTKLVYQALKKLDLYVVVDFFMTPCAELADYVLPATSWLERPEVDDFTNTHERLVAGEAALPSIVSGKYERKDDFEILGELGRRLGQEKYWPWKTLEEAYDERISPLGMTHREFMSRGGIDFPQPKFKTYEKQGFGTTTGKAELYSTVLEKLGYDPLPSWVEPPESPLSRPDIVRDYPFILITGGRTRGYFHSEWRQVDFVRKKHPDPLVQLNRKTATELQINDGDWVWIETLRGRCRQKAQLLDNIHPTVVHAEHGWWYPEMPGGEPWLRGVWESNINICMDDDPDHCNPISGNWPLKTALCKVYKATGY